MIPIAVKPCFNCGKAVFVDSALPVDDKPSRWWCTFLCHGCGLNESMFLSRPDVFFLKIELAR